MNNFRSLSVFRGVSSQNTFNRGDRLISRIMSFSRIAVFATLLGASLLGTSANAQVYGGCRERVRRAEIRLQQAINRHGWNSRQARARRRDLERAHASCRLDRRGYGYGR